MNGSAEFGTQNSRFRITVSYETYYHGNKCTIRLTKTVIKTTTKTTMTTTTTKVL